MFVTNIGRDTTEANFLRNRSGQSAKISSNDSCTLFDENILCFIRYRSGRNLTKNSTCSFLIFFSSDFEWRKERKPNFWLFLRYFMYTLCLHFMYDKVFKPFNSHIRSLRVAKLNSKFYFWIKNPYLHKMSIDSWARVFGNAQGRLPFLTISSRSIDSIHQGRARSVQLDVIHCPPRRSLAIHLRAGCKTCP